MIRDEATNSWYCRGKTISELMAKAIRGHLECPKPDAVLNIETHLFNSILTADSCEYDLDIGRDVWLNKGRWSRLIKEYVPKESLERFIGQAVEIMTRGARLGATANMMFRDPARYAKKHRWGGCLIGATFRGDNKKSGKATLTFYSRTTYIGYMGLLDAAIAHCIAKEIGRKCGWIGPQHFAFRWHISSQQVHCFKSLPYVYSQPDLMKRLEKLGRNPALIDKQPPTWRHMGKWYHKVVSGHREWQRLNYEMNASGSIALALEENEIAQGWLDTEKYGPFRRIKRRWCEYKGYLNKHVPPSLPVSTLTFEKAI